MKKVYCKPTIEAYTIKPQCIISTSTDETEVNEGYHSAPDRYFFWD